MNTTQFPYVPCNLDIVVDAFWGSSGKGKLAASLADRVKYNNLSSSNYPNAGHTTEIDGMRFVTKALPASHITCPEATVWLTPGSGVNMEQLITEFIWHEPQINVHERAVIMNHTHKAREEAENSVKGIASTLQGCGVAMCDKILRKEPLLFQHLGRDGLPAILDEKLDVLPPDLWVENVITKMLRSETWLHEVSQGYALSIDWGSDYPHCTSRNCGASQAMEQLGLPPHYGPRDVWLNVRTYPIRVGNLEDGFLTHSSGPFTDKSTEVSIMDIFARAEIPEKHWDYIKKLETTTVTKRQRRMATIDFAYLKRVALANGATKIALNFAQYLDWKDHKLQDPRKLSYATRAFIDTIEEVTGVPVCWVGTGASHEDVCWRMS